MNELLDWSAISWDRFQKLCIYLAQEQFKNLRFEEYLKPGNDQDGIDIISTTQKPKYTTIQCKHEKLTITKLTKVFKRFRESEFFRSTSHFILATTSDLQTERIQRYIKDIKEEFVEYDIVIECWDCTYLADQLVSYYTIVEKFFGLNVAKKHCFFQIDKWKISHEPLANYVNRKIILFDEKAVKSSYSWYLRKDESVELINLLDPERLSNPKRLCIIGDPYQGKSSLLKQTAYLLTKRECPYVPIIVDLKYFTVQPIENILNRQMGAWQSTPISDLVIFIDGLDEVPTDKFDEIILHIKEFAMSFPSLSIVLSCRTLFYAHYSIKDKLQDFRYFELFDLSRIDVDTYIKGILHRSYDNFIEKIRELDLENLLYDPFYLTEIINSYKEPPHRLPKSKAEVLQKFIAQSIQKSSLRKLRRGSHFKHKLALYQLTIQRLAFSLQLLGLNSIEESVLQRLFNEDELEVLQHSPLIKIEHHKWSFLSALFQEYLTARILARLSYETVANIVTVGKVYVKIKAKWLQTFTTLLALLEKGSLRDKYITLLEKDNIELLFETDRSKFDENFRYEVLKKMLDKCANKNIGPTIVYEDKIGAFVGSDQRAINLLLSKLSQTSSRDSLKMVCCDIMEHTKLSNESTIELIKICDKEIKKTKAVGVASRCVKLLSICRAFTEEMAAELVVLKAHNEHHEYRKEVYRYLTEASLVDKFFDYGINGLPVLIQYNSGISHLGSEYFLLTFFQSIRQPGNLQKLLTRLIDKDCIKFFRYNSEKQRLINGLVSAGIEIHKNFPWIILSFVEYIKNLGERALLLETDSLDRFFTETGSQRVLVGMLYNDMLNGKGVDYGSFLSKDTLPYLLFELEENNYRANRLWHIVYSLRQRQKQELANELYSIANELDSLESADEENNGSRKWEDLEKIKRENDLKYFLSAEALKKAIRSFFKYHKKKEISVNDVYIGVDDSVDLKQIASHLMSYLMGQWVQKGKKVCLKDCLDFIDDHDSFVYFKAQEGMNLLGDKDIPEIKQFLESYYHDLLESANFENCIYRKGNEIYYRKKEQMIGRLFEKYKFDTSVETLIKMIWLDCSSARMNINDEDDKNPSITKLIVERLPTEYINELKDQLLANMQLGISEHSVFGRHAALCHYFGIFEARDIILQRIILGDIGRFDTTYLCKYYIELEGDPEQIKPVFEGSIYDEYIFMELADLLTKYLPEYVEGILLKYLTLPVEVVQRKAEAAVRLCKMGQMHGFKFWVDCIKKNGVSPIDIQGPYTVSKLDTALALQEVDTIIHHILDEERGAFHNTARRIILEWIFTLATKSEKDLKVVVNFLNRCRAKLKANPRVDYLYWYIDQCIEKFRENGVANIDLNEVKAQLEALPEGELYF